VLLKTINYLQHNEYQLSNNIFTNLFAKVYNKERLYVTHSINQKLAAAPQFVKLLLGKYYD